MSNSITAPITIVKNVIDAPINTSARDAYQLAVAGGFVGTRAEWLASLIGAEGARVIISITPPLNPVDGQLWYDPEDAVMSFWTGNEWVTEDVAITSGDSSAFAKALIFG